ncbi:hypothetical protein NDU88_006944 [Pleurodeles waltl]|uniref:Uncharacterized protein n=1 Tax=Pleurodeles waltl TaxID=8319 RepID=A0AAV7UNQ1_PLEWA|nr:hypothetical protein NDU88_006944 [Pleurodeles waltl]
MNTVVGLLKWDSWSQETPLQEVRFHCCIGVETYICAIKHQLVLRCAGHERCCWPAESRLLVKVNTVQEGTISLMHREDVNVIVGLLKEDSWSQETPLHEVPSHRYIGEETYMCAIKHQLVPHCVGHKRCCWPAESRLLVPVNTTQGGTISLMHREDLNAIVSLLKGDPWSQETTHQEAPSCCCTG